jgi:hypothetical protein
MNRFALYGSAFCVGIALLLFSTTAFGQERGFAQKGVVELGGNVSFSSISFVSGGDAGDATTLFSFGPRVGYFVTDGFEIGFNPGLSFVPLSGFTVISPSGGESTTLLQLFVYPGYTIRTEKGNAYPFIEVPFGYTSASSGGDDLSGFSWGVRGGVKIAAVGAMLVTIYGEYFQLTLNRPGADKRNGYNYLSFGVGIGGFI